MKNKTLIVGLGNDILSDDGVGLRVAGILKDKLPEEVAEIEEYAVGGWDLLETMKGYSRAILIDSIKTREGKPGDLYKLTLEDLRPTYHITNPHRLNFITILDLGKEQGYNIPEIVIYAIEVKDNTTFSESFTDEVEAAVESIVSTIIQENFKGYVS